MTVTARPPLYEELVYLGGAEAYSDEVHEVMGNMPLFEAFSHAEIDALCQYMHCFAAPRNVTLIREGDDGNYMFIVLTGNILVHKAPMESDSVTLASLGAGNMVGEMALIDGEPRFATCVTTAPTDIATLTRADFDEILITHPRLANKLLIRMLQLVAARMRHTGSALVNLSLLTSNFRAPPRTGAG